MIRARAWAPFGRNGRRQIVCYTDPWWGRLYARLRGWPLWHQVGYFAEGPV